MNQIQPTEPVSGSTPPSQPGTSDDVWGVHRPPVLGGTPQPTGYPTPPQDSPSGAHGSYRSQGSYGPHGPNGQSSRPGHSSLDRGFAALQKAPLHRDTRNGVIGGVSAGIAQRLGISVAAVRVATVALALFFGTGVGAYLLLWALLPDEAGTTHVERGVKGGSGRSLAVLGLGVVAALGILATIFDGLGWLVPVGIAAAVAYVVTQKKGHSRSHSHG